MSSDLRRKLTEQFLQSFDPQNSKESKGLDQRIEFCRETIFALRRQLEDPLCEDKELLFNSILVFSINKKLLKAQRATKEPQGRQIVNQEEQSFFQSFNSFFETFEGKIFNVFAWKTWGDFAATYPTQIAKLASAYDTSRHYTPIEILQKLVRYSERTSRFFEILKCFRKVFQLRVNLKSAQVLLESGGEGSLGSEEPRNSGQAETEKFFFKVFCQGGLGLIEKFARDLELRDFEASLERFEPFNHWKAFQVPPKSLLPDFIRTPDVLGSAAKTPITGNPDWLLRISESLSKPHRKMVELAMTHSPQLEAFAENSIESIFLFLRGQVQLHLMRKFMVLRMILRENYMFFDEKYEVELDFQSLSIAKIYSKYFSDEPLDKLYPLDRLSTRLSERVRGLGAKFPSESRELLDALIFLLPHPENSDEVKISLNAFLADTLKLETKTHFLDSKPFDSILALHLRIYALLFRPQAEHAKPEMAQKLVNKLLTSIVEDEETEFPERLISLTAMLAQEDIVPILSSFLSKLKTTSSINQAKVYLNKYFDQKTLEKLSTQVFSATQKSVESVGINFDPIAELQNLTWLAHEHPGRALDYTLGSFAELLAQGNCRKAYEYYTKVTSLLFLQFSDKRKNFMLPFERKGCFDTVIDGIQASSSIVELYNNLSIDSESTDASTIISVDPSLIESLLLKIFEAIFARSNSSLEPYFIISKNMIPDLDRRERVQTVLFEFLADAFFKFVKLRHTNPKLDEICGVFLMRFAFEVGEECFEINAVLSSGLRKKLMQTLSNCVYSNVFAMSKLIAESH